MSKSYNITYEMVVEGLARELIQKEFKKTDNKGAVSQNSKSLKSRAVQVIAGGLAEIVGTNLRPGEVIEVYVGPPR